MNLNKSINCPCQSQLDILKSIFNVNFVWRKFTIDRGNLKIVKTPENDRELPFIENTNQSPILWFKLKGKLAMI